MKMKKEKNNSSAKRFIIILSLALALLAVLGVVSFAWIRNYVDVDTLEIKSGKMLYNFRLYRASDVGNPTLLFDTNIEKDSKDAELDKRLEREITNAIVNVEYGEEFFFVVEKYENSIDFDIALSFEKAGSDLKIFENADQMNFSIYDDSSKYNENPSGYFGGLKNNDNKGVPQSFGNIWTTIQKANVWGKDKYACIRLKLNRDADVSAAFEDNYFPLRIGFCIAQKGALPDEDGIDRYYVDSDVALKAVMQKYGFNDEIYINQNVEYSDDLIFTRPCTITLVHARLKVKGNLIFSYMYGGKFTVNTVSDGHIIVENDDGVGGNFRIDLPDTSIELIGSNTDPVSTTDWKNVNSDIYVEGSFTANASNNKDEGLLFRGTRVSNIKINGAKLEYSSELKPLLINGSTRMSLSNRTRLGKLSANLYCKHFILENSGYISGINLSGMAQDITMLSEPSILFDNAGTVADSLIVLPNWSKLFETTNKANNSADDNTHIIANKGSSELRAITAENLEKLNKGETTLEAIAAGDSFFSTGKKRDDGLRDDIDYLLRTQFVETIDNDNTKIKIHYETPSPIILNKGEYADLADLKVLKDYVDYYAAKGDIAPVDKLTEVRIICYGDKKLTAPPLKSGSKTEYETGLEYDYNFIKTMTSVTSLDLSDAVSEDKKVPDNAFKNMGSLKDVKMSESDAVWGQYIFTGTSVDEITFPQSLIKLDNPRNSFGVTAQNVLDGIRYVHTSIYVVDGFFLDSSAKQYLFTPDQYTYDAYRKHYGSVYWHSKIFLDVGVERFGEYFLRLNTKNNGEESTCEFVVFTGGLDSNGKLQKWVENEYNNCGFDFQKIIVEGKYYKITSYDPYALFEKLIAEENLEVVISEDVTRIGERAFACYYNVDTKIGLESVVIEGNPEIMGHAFSYNDALISFKAPHLTTLKGGNNFAINNVLKTFYAPNLTVVEGNGDISSCPALERVDIGVIQRTNNNKDFYTSNETYSYAKFYIHTDNAKNVSAYTSALAADYRHIFVHGDYADLYRTKNTPNYTGVVDMGENDLDALIAANKDGDNVSDVEQIAYYYILNGNEAHLVACMLPEINVTGDYTIIPSFDNGTYPVTYIGAAAYHFTAITAQNIIVPDSVEKIGDYAFDSKQTLFKKYCITFDLKNVVKAGTCAFYYMDMVRIIGDYLEEVATDTLSYNQNLIVANLPNLSRSRPVGTKAEEEPPRIFLGCGKLRISYTSASENIAFDNNLSRQYSYVRFINGKHASNGFQIAEVNTVVQGSVAPLQKDFWNNVVNVDNSFSQIYFSDYYYHSVSLNGLSADIRLPGYVFYKEDSGELTLFSVSPDIILFGDFGLNERNYITPNFLYSTGTSEYTSKDNGSEAKFAVTKLGKHAYGVTRMMGLDSFTVADNITVLDAFALSGSAYDSTNGSEIVTLYDVYRLDLANVTELGTRACARSNMVELDAPLLKKLGDSAFAESSKLLGVYLPNYEVAEVTNTFRYCASLERVTLGKNTTNLVYGMFDENDALVEIVILNDKYVIEILDTVKIIDDDNKNDVTISVPASVYAEYMSQYSNGFGGITKFNKFGQATTDTAGYTYYWNVIDKTAKTAFINYIEGTFSSGNFTIPSTLDGYTVVSVTAEAMAALTNVTKVILPANMEYLSFTASDLPNTVNALEISGSNSKFMTTGGVLYSKDGTKLLVYPKAKATINFTVPSAVTEIGYRAFYGSKKLQNLTINEVVTIRDQAFEYSSISTVNFTNATASIFAGRDILLDASSNIEIRIPSASLSAYKANVLIDYSIIEKFVGA